MSKPNPTNTRLSPEEFKSEIAQRGWTYNALGTRWGITPNWVSKISRDPNRPMHWDDAVRGLPYITVKH